MATLGAWEDGEDAPQSGIRFHLNSVLNDYDALRAENERLTELVAELRHDLQQSEERRQALHSERRTQDERIAALEEQLQSYFPDDACTQVYDDKAHTQEHEQQSAALKRMRLKAEERQIQLLTRLMHRTSGRISKDAPVMIRQMQQIRIHNQTYLRQFIRGKQLEQKTLKLGVFTKESSDLAEELKQLWKESVELETHLSSIANEVDNSSSRYFEFSINCQEYSPRMERVVIRRFPQKEGSAEFEDDPPANSIKMSDDCWLQLKHGLWYELYVKRRTIAVVNHATICMHNQDIFIHQSDVSPEARSLVLPHQTWVSSNETLEKRVESCKITPSDEVVLHAHSAGRKQSTSVVLNFKYCK